MTLSIKEGVVCDQLHPAMVTIIPTVMQLFARYNYPCVITEVNDTINRKHRSFHKGIPCRAIDWRTWTTRTGGEQIDPGIKAAMVADLRQELGPDYDVTWSDWNIHTEYDPK